MTDWQIFETTTLIHIFPATSWSWASKSSLLLSAVHGDQSLRVIGVDELLLACSTPQTDIARALCARLLMQVQMTVPHDSSLGGQ